MAATAKTRSEVVTRSPLREGVCPERRRHHHRESHHRGQSRTHPPQQHQCDRYHVCSHHSGVPEDETRGRRQQQGTRQRGDLPTVIGHGAIWVEPQGKAFERNVESLPSIASKSAEHAIVGQDQIEGHGNDAREHQSHDRHGQQPCTCLCNEDHRCEDDSHPDAERDQRAH